MSIEAGFRIGKRNVYPLEGRITGPEGDLRIEPKAMAVLIELARQAPGVCTREQLIQKVWPRGFVSDDVLTRCIGQLRRALDDGSHSPSHLETIPKRGYRLRTAVTTQDTTRDFARQPAPAGSSLIVLPFQNLSATGEDFIADGLTELLILRLAALKGIRVISRTTAMQFKGSPANLGEVARQTGVDFAIEGSVLQAGNHVQVVAQLIDARTDAHLWVADYLREIDELLPLQNEIAGRIAAAIRIQLGTESETPPVLARLEPAAMRSFLRGRHRCAERTVARLHEALADFQSVTADAPDFAPGWASLAECEMLLAHYGAPERNRLVMACESHLNRALALDADLAIGLSTRGAVRFFFRCDLAGATADLQRALSLLPSHSLAMVALANVCAARGEFSEASAWMDQALLVDPLDVGVNMNVGDHRILARRYEDAVRALETALKLHAGHRPSELRLSWALALAGHGSLARQRLAALSADSQWHEYSALVCAADGDAEGARQHYEALLAFGALQLIPAWSLARAAAAAQHKDSALAHLEAATRELSSSIPFLLVTPAFDSLHSEERFRALGAKLGLPSANGVVAPMARRAR